MTTGSLPEEKVEIPATETVENTEIAETEENL